MRLGGALNGVGRPASAGGAVWAAMGWRFYAGTPHDITSGGLAASVGEPCGGTQLLQLRSDGRATLTGPRLHPLCRRQHNVPDKQQCMIGGRS